MSAGKSEVVAWALQLADGSLDLYRCADPPNAADLAIAHEQKQKFVPLVPESLLLDARAELAAKDEAYRLQFEACASMNGKLERAEAMAGEYERDARRYDYLRKHANRISAGPYNAGFEWEWDEPHYAVPDRSLDAAIDAAIDAVGGRGKQTD